MDEARVPHAWRDYCAHLLIPLNECRYNAWFAPWKCGHERHLYEKCQYKVRRAQAAGRRGEGGLLSAAGIGALRPRGIEAHAAPWMRIGAGVGDPSPPPGWLPAGVQTAGRHLHRGEAQGGRACMILAGSSATSGVGAGAARPAGRSLRPCRWGPCVLPAAAYTNCTAGRASSLSLCTLTIVTHARQVWGEGQGQQPKKSRWALGRGRDHSGSNGQRSG